MRKPYILIKKKLKGKTVYYFQVWDSVNHKYMNARSCQNATSKAQALQYVERYLVDHVIVLRSDMLFSTFTKNFFDTGSLYLTELQTNRKKNQRKMSEASLMNSRSILDKHLNPYFGTYRLQNISENDIRLFLANKQKEVSTGYTQNILLCLKKIMDFAFDRKLLSINPISKIPGIDIERKPKGILSIEEVKLLFSDSSNFPNKLHYLLNMLAVVSGCRKGELVALQWADLIPPFIIINKSHQQQTNVIKCTKTDKERKVIASPKIFGLLYGYRVESSFNEDMDFIFSVKKNRPVSPNEVLRTFYKALKKIGINHKNRNIDFHSYRRFANSMYISSGIALTSVHKTIGHSTDEMSELYFRQEESESYIQIQERLFS